MTDEKRRVAVRLTAPHRSLPLLASIAALLLLPLSSGAFSAEPAGQPTAKIVVSKETMFIVGPLRADGSVDFAAALNELGSKGVSPENNAAVGILQAIGPRVVPEKHRAKYFKLLGIPPLADTGSYYIPWSSLGEKFNSKPSECFGRPWSEKEFPRVAEWLKRNEKPLEIAIGASQRSAFYWPYIPKPRPTQKELLQGPMRVNFNSELRELEKALIARAMLRLNAGRFADAFADALACHRLGRLEGRGPLLSDLLLGYSADSRAQEIDYRLAGASKLTRDEARKFERELAALSPFKPGPTLLTGLRICYVQTICEMTADPAAKIREVFGPYPAFMSSDQNAEVESLAVAVAKHAPDWNAVLRQVNSGYDRIGAAYELPTFAKRHAALATLRASFSEHPTHPAAKGDGGGEQSANAKRLANFVLDEICLEFSQTDRALGIQSARLGMARISFALAAWRADHEGKYPAGLTDLVPQYIRALPQDPFADSDFHFKRDGIGCLLYSVGPNGKDDGGKGPWAALSTRRTTTSPSVFRGSDRNRRIDSISEG